MKLFVNDKYVHVVDALRQPPTMAGYDLEISPEIPLNAVKLAGRVLVWAGTPAYMDALLTLMEVKKLKKLEQVTFVTERYEEVKEFIKAQFKIVKAAGGLVYKGEQMLMIYRLGLWDLPKGKLEKGERTLEAAIREVTEECAIAVSAEEKIVSTWHTYVAEGGRRILKKTTWYRMACLSDASMAPQKEEGIEDIRWMSRAQVVEALEKSYRSIQEVFATEWSRVENVGGDEGFF